MRLIFAGTPRFAAASLIALRDAGHDIALVLTQPDRPAGRGMKSTPSAVAEEANRIGLPLLKPGNLKSEETHAALREICADVMVVAAYGLLLPPAVLQIPRLGCINIHASLLPRWRGAAPVQRAIEAGDAETGIAIMQMDAGLDTGALLLERRIDIAPEETSASLFEKLTILGAHSIVDALGALPTLVPHPQPSSGATYARKIDKAEGHIDWHQPATVIERRIRAFDPFPGCETRVTGTRLKIWQAQINDATSGYAPGTVVATDDKTLTIQCGEQQLRLKVVQKPGSRRMMIDEFLRGYPVLTGVVLQ